MVKDLRGASPEAAVAAERAQGGRCMSGRSAALGIPLEFPSLTRCLMQHHFSACLKIHQLSDFTGKTEGIKKELSYLPSTEI